ncbi:MAG: TolC family protein, partial [Endomicrobia bacterium]|nr:TolC family protein [Endomicrobiia bacterium]
MKKYIYFLSFFLSCGLSTKFYCEVKNLTWQQIVKEAKQKNPQLQQTIINFNQARIKLESIKSEFYPQISLSASTSKNLHKEYEPEVGYSYNLSAGITLFSGFSRVNNLKAQIIEMEIMQESYKRTLANLIASLKENYIDVYYTQESINLSEKILQRRRQNYELVKLKYASGKEDIGALLRVEADMLQAEYELNRAKRALEVALRTLLKNIGEEQIFMIKIVDKIEDTNDIKIEDLLKKDVLE